MNKLTAYVWKVEEILVVLFLSCLTVIVFVNVILRYVFQHSVGWAEELSRYCFIMGTYIGLSIVTRQEKHISIDAIDFVLPKMKKYMDLCGDILFIGYLLAIIPYAVKMAIFFFKSDEVSIAMQLPMWIPYVAIPVGFFLSLIRLLTQLPRKITALRIN